MEYNFREIEKKWHDYWIAEKVYKVEKDTNKPKYYVLDMFPYPSGGEIDSRFFSLVTQRVTD